MASACSTVSVNQDYAQDVDFSSYRSFDIAAGQPVNFFWRANADAYLGNIVSMRHGWEVKNVDDPQDLGWVVPPGLSEQNRYDQERVFQDGIHTFVLQHLH